MEALVSVIIPIYNTEQYLKRCVESVLVQTYQNLQVILVDDGSPDKCPNLCDMYAESDSRIIVIHKENGGQSSARNAGIEIATGDYITFLDSDDYLHSEFISRMVFAKEKSNVDIVQCEIKSVLNDKEHTEKDIDLHKWRILSGREAVLSYKYKVSACAKLYNSKLFESIRFPEGKIFEDEATYYKLAYICKNVCLISEALYFYVQSNNSTMRNKQQKLCMDFITVAEDRLAFFENTGDYQLIQNALARYCITLILKHRLCKRKKIDKATQKILIKNFKNNYSKVDKTLLSRRDRILYRLYFFFPNLTAQLLSGIKK